MSIRLEKEYKSKRVLVTGNTGFKGSWLSQWLLLLNAEVFGYALQPPTVPSLFKQLRLDKHSRHNDGDIRNLEALKNI